MKRNFKRGFLSDEDIQKEVKHLKRICSYHNSDVACIVECLSDEAFNEEMLKNFSTAEMINVLIERCELCEAYKAYLDDNSQNMVNDMIKQLSANKQATKAFISELLSVPYWSTGDEYAEAMKNFINN